MNIHCHGTPNKVYETCKFWTEKKCRNSSDVCRYIHSYYCPDGEQCSRIFCTMYHIRRDSKKAMMANKTVIGSCTSKQRNNERKRRQNTYLPQGNESTIFESPSNSSDWNCSSVAFEDFDEELCQGLEEVGQELDRFEEEVSESSECEDEAICVKEMNYPSEHSSQDATLSHKHPLKSEAFSEVSCESNRSMRNMVSAGTSSQARRLDQGKQNELLDKPGRALQNIPVINSNYQRKNIHFKQEDACVLIDLKKKNVPFISVESTTAVDSNYISKYRIKSPEISNYQPKQNDRHTPCISSHNNKNGFVANKIMKLNNFCASSADPKDKDCGFNIKSLFNLVAKIRGESDEVLKEQEHDDRNVTLMSSKSGSRNSCHSNNLISSQTIDSSYVSSHSAPLEGISGYSASDVFKDNDREEGEICEDDEIKELMALVSQKQQLVHKVKMLVMQKNNLSLQRDSIMNSFTGDTAKLTKILNENSQLLKEISTHILKLNAQIKLTSRKIDILENNRSFTKTTEMKDYDNSKEQVNVSGCSVSSQPKKLALSILELFESISRNKKKPSYKRIRNECGDKLKDNTARTNCRNCSESLTEQSAILSNNYSLHDDEINGIFAVKEMHVPDQVEKLEVRNSANHVPEQNVDEDLGTTDITQKEKSADSESHHNSEESKLVMTSEKKSSPLEQYSNVDTCNGSLMQEPFSNSFKNDFILTEQQIQNDVKILGEDLCKESEKTFLNKGKMSNSSKDMSTHWCKACNVFFTHVYGYVKHLESSKHMEQIKDDDTEKWVQKLPHIDTEKQPEGSGGNQETVGVEFLHSAKVFFCELCESLIWNAEEAVLHPQSPLHVKKYKEHVLKNTNQEVDFLQAKMAAFTKYCEERIARSKGTAMKELGEANDTVENVHKTSEDCSSENKCMNDSDSDVICLGNGESKSKKFNDPSENKRKLVCNEKERKKFKLASQEVSKPNNIKKKGKQDRRKTLFPSEFKNTHGKKNTSWLSPAEVWIKALPSLHLRQQPHSP